MFELILFLSLSALQLRKVAPCKDLKKLTNVEKKNILKNLKIPDNIFRSSLYKEIEIGKSSFITSNEDEEFFEIIRYNNHNHIILDQFKLHRKLHGVFPPKFFFSENIFCFYDIDAYYFVYKKKIVPKNEYKDFAELKFNQVKEFALEVIEIWRTLEKHKAFFTQRVSILYSFSFIRQLQIELLQPSFLKIYPARKKSYVEGMIGSLADVVPEKKHHYFR